MRYRDQFYNEGFGTTFYLKPVRYINRKVKNKHFKKFLLILVKVLYTIIFIIFGIVMFIVQFPL